MDPCDEKAITNSDPFPLANIMVFRHSQYCTAATIGLEWLVYLLLNFTSTVKRIPVNARNKSARNGKQMTARFESIRNGSDLCHYKQLEMIPLTRLTIWSYLYYIWINKYKHKCTWVITKNFCNLYGESLFFHLLGG